MLYFVDFQSAYLAEMNLQGVDLFSAQLQGSNLKNTKLEGAFLNTELQGTDLSGANLKGAYFRKDEHHSFNLESKKPTVFPFESKLKSDTPCLTNDKKLPICKKYNPKDTETLNKITSYWINDLACSDKWMAQNVITNFLFSEDKFKTYLIPLLKKKLNDKDCTGIQNLPDDFKQQIKDAINQP